MFEIEVRLYVILGMSETHTIIFIIITLDIEANKHHSYNELSSVNLSDLHNNGLYIRNMMVFVEILMCLL